MQIKIAVRSPVFHFVIFVFTNSTQVTDSDGTHSFLHTPFDDVFRESVEVVSAAIRPLTVELLCPLRRRVTAVRDVLAEVVAVFFQTAKRVQFRGFIFVGKCSKRANAEVDSDG